jgi:hypothetical protein
MARSMVGHMLTFYVRSLSFLTYVPEAVFTALFNRFDTKKWQRSTIKNSLPIVLTLATSFW